MPFATPADRAVDSDGDSRDRHGSGTKLADSDATRRALPIGEHGDRRAWPPSALDRAAPIELEGGDRWQVPRARDRPALVARPTRGRGRSGGPATAGAPGPAGSAP